ncbi:MAG: sugar phosphate isomerase/epimerase [Lachnospiraceae bacterium]|nr:sugar phosphate isomerase/epimerase [Lachnospiraceae bacterium]
MGEIMRKGIHFLFGAKDSVTDFPAVIDRFSAVGFDSIELPPEPFLADGGKAAAKIAAYGVQKGVEITFSCGFSKEYDMASEDRKIREQGVSHMKRILEVMDKSGIRLIGGTPYTCWPAERDKPLGLDEKKRMLERTADIFGQCIRGIETAGIEVAIEPLNRFEGFLINTAQEGVYFCELVGNRNLGIMLDGFHMSMEEDSIRGAVLAAGSRLKHLHLAENNRKLPGMGEFPWNTFFAALKEIDYKGRLSIESFMVPGGLIASDVALWRDLGLPDKMEEQDGMLQDALKFIGQMSETYGLFEGK